MQPGRFDSVVGGFTLIELSIVLVIIGLIIGGVLVGQDLIAAAGVRAQIAQIEKYQTAVNTFRGKYGYLPGDIPDPAASQYGFVARGSSQGQGDGSGVIECNYVLSGVTGFNEACGETGVFWADLSEAGLVDGDYSAANADILDAGANGNIAASQLNQYMPTAKIGQGNYVYVWSGGWKTIPRTPGDNLNYFGISAMTTIDIFGFTTSNVSLTVQQAYNIDQKIDDGLPQSGRIIAMFVNQFPYWAAGNNNPEFGGGAGFGDMDADTYGPITSQTTNPWYADQNGSALTDLCYDNGDTLQPEHYSMEINNGAGLNCALSFLFQ